MNVMFKTYNYYYKYRSQSNFKMQQQVTFYLPYFYYIETKRKSICGDFLSAKFQLRIFFFMCVSTFIYGIMLVRVHTYRYHSWLKNIKKTTKIRRKKNKGRRKKNIKCDMDMQLKRHPRLNGFLEVAHFITMEKDI